MKCRFMPSVLMILLTTLALVWVGQVDAADDAAQAQLAEAKQALWGSDFQKAEQLLDDYLETNEDDYQARRWLILAHLALGRDDRLPDDLEQYGEGAPHSIYDRFLIQVIDQYTALSGQGFQKRLYEFAESIVENEQEGSIPWRRALELKAEYGKRTGEFGETEDCGDDRQLIKQWSLLGPFDNTSGSGESKTFITTFALTDEIYEGKYGLPITWFTPRFLSMTGVVQPTSYFHRKTFTTTYARTCVNIPTAGTYQLHLGNGGELEFFVNDESVYSVSRKSPGGESLQGMLDLPAGWVTLGVKISGRDTPGHFNVALTQVDGLPIEDLVIDPQGGKTTEIDNLNPRPIVDTYLAEIDARLEADPTDPDTAFWSLYKAAEHSTPDIIKEVCQTNLERFPESGLIRLAVIGQYGRLGLSTIKHIRETAEMAPELAQVRLLEGQREMEKRRHARAGNIADAVLDIAPSCYGAWLLKIQSLAEDELWEDLKPLALRVSRLFPEESGPLEALAMAALENDDPNAATKFSKRAAKCLSPIDRLIEEFRILLGEEEYDDARHRIDDLMDIAPDVAEIRAAHVHMLFVDNRYLQAKDLCFEYLGSFPQNIQLLRYAARLVENRAAAYGVDYKTILALNDGPAMEDYLKSSSKEKAAMFLERALACEPGDFSLRDQINQLRGLESFRTVMDDPVYSEIADARVEPDQYKDDAAVVLLSQKRRLAYMDGACLVDYLIAVQVLDESGAERWENVPLGQGYYGDPVVLARTIYKKNGDEDEGRLLFDRVLFPDLSPGDVLLLHYQATEFVSGNLSGEFWDQFVFGFPEDPSLKSRYELWCPIPKTVVHRAWNIEADIADLLPDQPTAPKGLRRLVWELEDIPAMSRELLSADIRRTSPWLDISTLSDWRQISKWYADLAIGQTEVTADVQDKADELTRDCTTEAEAVARIFEYVAGEINYENIPFFQSAYVPRPAGEVLGDGFGDCKDKACLMISLLKAAGHNGFCFSLVTPGAPADRPFLPSPRFNHAIVVGRDADAPFQWYDPTLKYAEAGQVPGHLRGSLALVVARSTHGLAEIKSDAPMDSTPFGVSTKATVLPSGDLVAHRTEQFRYIDHKIWVRNAHTDLSAAEQCEMEARRLAAESPGVVVDSVRVAGLEIGSGSVEVRTDYQAPEFGYLDQDMVSLRLPWTSHLAREYGVVVSEPTRTTPLDLKLMNLCERDTVVLSLPVGTELKSLPKPVDFTWEGCSYRTSYAKGAGGIIGIRDVTVAGESVEPAIYAEFRQWLNTSLRDLRRVHHIRVQ